MRCNQNTHEAKRHQKVKQDNVNETKSDRAAWLPLCVHTAHMGIAIIVHIYTTQNRGSKQNILNNHEDNCVRFLFKINEQHSVHSHCWLESR